MTGKLTLLPKKSYTPWNIKNIERVLHDEQLELEKNQSDSIQKRRKERVDRISRMKKSFRSSISNPKDINYLKTKEKPTPKTDADSDRISELKGNYYFVNMSDKPGIIGSQNNLASGKNISKEMRHHLSNTINIENSNYNVPKLSSNNICSTTESTLYQLNNLCDTPYENPQKIDFLKETFNKYSSEDINDHRALRKNHSNRQHFNEYEITPTIFDKLKEKQIKREMIESLRQRDLLLHNNIYPLRIIKLS